MEDDPAFDAGIGSYLNRAGTVELDASFTRVTSVTRVVLSKCAVDALANDRHPNDAARVAIEILARRVGGTAGIILADRLGRIGFAYNTARMTWAYLVQGMPDVVGDC